MTGAFAEIKRRWLLYHLGDPRFSFMWDAPPPDEWIALDCETTGLDVRRDEIVAIAAVRIRGNRILCSERLELLVKPERRAVSADSVRVHGLRERDVAQGIAMDDALKQLMVFIGSRPLVGYYLEFDVAMIDRALFPMLGMGLPQPKIEVSALYYEYKNRQRPVHERGGDIDLRFATIMSDLGLPQRPAHDALNDAVMAALAFLKLRGLGS
ncbi:3'-5' exonuclease [Variovorax sp. YR216]|uniref:3'-5' exonuclease n=1 Tax=Variovorax sp. YR216 TaxID=1882828 RepID=UPI00089AD7F4|nr:3'-5' exonuclease [Variovorax sp. YR216]SEB19924.1 DNA polymerase-3 subunit epsilon [Variovorax sp. YR216]